MEKSPGPDGQIGQTDNRLDTYLFGKKNALTCEKISGLDTRDTIRFSYIYEAQFHRETISFYFFYQMQITLRIVGYHFSSRLTAALNLRLTYLKLTNSMASAHVILK